MATETFDEFTISNKPVYPPLLFQFVQSKTKSRKQVQLPKQSKESFLMSQGEFIINNFNLLH